MKRKTVAERARKIHRGKYKYKNYILLNYGYYPPDRCVWWEATNIETGYADYHANTKREIMKMIDAKG